MTGLCYTFLKYGFPLLVVSNFVPGFGSAGGESRRTSQALNPANIHNLRSGEQFY